MSTMTTKSRLFIDLDGTVARFYDASPNYLEQMYEKGYFRNLQPYEEMTEGIKLFMEQHKDVEVFTLSAKVNGEPPYCEAEKQEWLDEYLPEIDREHRLFTEIGHNKAEYIPNGISNTDVLYDDYNKNLIDWENSGGGHCRNADFWQAVWNGLSAASHNRWVNHHCFYFRFFDRSG